MKIRHEASKSGNTGPKNGTHRLKISNQPVKTGVTGLFSPAVCCFYATSVNFLGFDAIFLPAYTEKRPSTPGNHPAVCEKEPGGIGKMAAQIEIIPALVSFLIILFA